MSPEASIIIPNFNNGRQSARDRSTDLLGDLLASIERTLGRALSRTEVLVADDGSTDDSLETARRWVGRISAAGHPACRLVELEHCGVLSRVLNRLMASTSAPIVFRFDGDIVLGADDWLDGALGRFTADERLGLLGGCQLDPAGSVLGLGDLLFHPHGYQHLGAGLERPVDHDPFEPDHVMGCFHVMRRSAFEEVGPYDESILRGQTIDLTIRLRQAGWRLLTEPGLRYEHRHRLRADRSSRSDAPEGIRDSLEAFRDKWGFDRLCPDIDRMRSRLGAQLVPIADLDPRMLSGGIDPPAEELENRVRLMEGLVVPGRPLRIAALGAGDGRMETILAGRGILVTGIEDRLDAHVAGQRLRSVAPDHRVPALVENLSSVDLPDHSLDLVLVDRVLERHPNPIRLLAELDRLLSEAGTLVLVARWRSPEAQLHQPRQIGHFTPSGLRSFLQNSGFFRSVPFTERPLAAPEPDVLVYALRRRGALPPLVAEPTLCN